MVFPQPLESEHDHFSPRLCCNLATGLGRPASGLFFSDPQFHLPHEQNDFPKNASLPFSSSENPAKVLFSLWAQPKLPSLASRAFLVLAPVYLPESSVNPSQTKIGSCP